MPETPPVQADLFSPSSPPRAEATGVPASSPAVAAAGTPLAGDLALLQPWLQALRQARSIAQVMAQALTPALVAAYIERFLPTDQAPSRVALEAALAAQRPDLVQHLRTWLRRRPIPPRQEAVWQALYHWLQPRLLPWLTPGLEATLGPAPLEARPPEVGATTVQDAVCTTACPLAQVEEVMRQETADLVQALTQALDLPQRTHEEIQALLRLRPIQRAADRPHPLSPLFLNRTLAPVATGSPMLSSAQALVRPDLWRPDGENVPTYRRLFTHGHSIEHYVTKTDPTSRSVEALAGEAAWQIVHQYGLPTAFLHLVFAAYAAEQAEPWRGHFELRGSDLLRTLGLEKRTDVPRAEKLREVARQADLLGSLGVWVVWRESTRDLSVQMSRMWDVALDMRGLEDPEGGGLAPTEVVLIVRPGLWTEKFLNAAGARAGTALRQFSYLAQSTLRIDPYHQELAAKLAVYLTLMSRLRRTYHVQHLLETLEPAALLRQVAADRGRRYRFKQRWDETLLTLHEHGWQLAFDAETYPVALRPDWALPPDTPAHLRRLPADYWRLLLAATLTFTPPEPIPALLAAGVEEERPARRVPTRPTSRHLAPPRLPPPLTGSQVRQARQATGWSQQELARRVGKSQQWVAFIEQGKRAIHPQDQATLRTLLTLVPEPPES
jgi:DNA-binding transcriptional regulator YiaG